MTRNNSAWYQSPRTWIVAAAIILIGGAGFVLFTRSTTPTPSGAGQQSAPASPGPTSSPTTSDGSQGGRSGTGQSSSPAPTRVNSFDELPVDEQLVSRALVEDTVCGLDRRAILLLVGAQDGAAPDLNLVRDAAVTLDDQIQIWRQSLGLDPRIDASVRAAEAALTHWRKAIYFADEGQTRRANAQMVSANADLERIDRERPTDLCPQ